MDELRVVETFSGIGTQSLALKKARVPHKVVAISEIDADAITSYEAIHGKANNLGDIAKVKGEDVPDHDLLTYSFPCTDVSVSGKQAGLTEGSGTSSSLLWEVRKIVEVKKPKYLLMENVDNLVSKKFIDGFNKWQEWLESQGYTNSWKVINANQYVPQRRSRVLMVSILGDEKFQFSTETKTRALDNDLIDLLEDMDDEEVLESFKDPSIRSGTVGEVTYYNPISDYYKEVSSKSKANYIGYIGNAPKQATRVYPPIESSTLTANGGGQGGKTGLYHLGTHIRNLSSLEAWRLTGVSDEDYYKAKATGISKTQLLKQAGNAIVVDVMVDIFKELFKDRIVEDK